MTGDQNLLPAGPERTRTGCRGEPLTRVGVVATTAAGRGHAARIVAAWPHAEMVSEPTVVEGLRRAWRENEAVVAFAATGLVVRALAPLLHDKRSDPAVVVVDEAARHAVPLLGGHLGGANELAHRLAELLGARPVVTTATDVRQIPGLDTLGWPLQGAVAAVTRAVLDGEPVSLQADHVWPLPALPANVLRQTPAAPAQPAQPAQPAHRILVTDRLVPDQAGTVVLRPPSLVVGVGTSRGADAAEIVGLVEGCLARAGLSRDSVRHLATVEARAEEPGLVQAAAELGLPLVAHPAADLAEVPVPNPSEVVARAVGTPSVAEAACLLPAPGRAELVVTKTTSAGAPAMVTVAVARHRPRGRLALVGIGPGARDLLTPRAVTELRAASVVAGLDQYVEQVVDLLRPGTTVLASRMRQERRRVSEAVQAARDGHAVALVGSGDAGIYAMASPALEKSDDSFDVVTVPGVTASLAASALLGAPLGHDHAVISLSDLHTPWPVIQARVAAAARGDLVVVLYNPRSHGRDWQLGAALAELATHRCETTPVGIVRQASRPGESTRVTTLAEIDPSVVDMYTTVIVGSSQTRVVSGRMVTPRGYSWLRAGGNGDTGPAGGRTARGGAAARREVSDIETRSYRILRTAIRERLGETELPPLTRAVIERVVHASADCEYATDLVCTESALESGRRALLAGAPVATDVRMVAAGITARHATGQVICRIDDPRTAELAAHLGITRAAAGIRVAYDDVGDGAVWVIGNAPTAVFELLAIDARPALVIGLPVGFVAAAESKAELLRSGLPALANRSARGGSALAAAALNALLYTDPDGGRR
jgi:cobalt-precorrin 5A hydrolase/precorrin-3B C17-methyltransferase